MQHSTIISSQNAAKHYAFFLKCSIALCIALNISAEYPPVLARSPGTHILGGAGGVGHGAEGAGGVAGGVSRGVAGVPAHIQSRHQDQPT